MFAERERSRFKMLSTSVLVGSCEVVIFFDSNESIYLFMQKISLQFSKIKQKHKISIYVEQNDKFFAYVQN